MSDTPRTDAADVCFARLLVDRDKRSDKRTTTELVDANFARQLERELAAAQTQRDKAIAHLVNMLHAADELADCVGITKWDTEIDMARIFLKECGK